MLKHFFFCLYCSMQNYLFTGIQPFKTNIRSPMKFNTNIKSFLISFNQKMGNVGIYRPNPSLKADKTLFIPKSNYNQFTYGAHRLATLSIADKNILQRPPKVHFATCTLGGALPSGKAVGRASIVTWAKTSATPLYQEKFTAVGYPLGAKQGCKKTYSSLSFRPLSALPNGQGVKSCARMKGKLKNLFPLVDRINRRLFFQEKQSSLWPRPNTLRFEGVQGTQDKQAKKFFTKKRFFYSKKHIATISVHSSRNNTLLTLSGGRDRVLKGGWASAGSLGFKNSRKSTTYASQAGAKRLALRAKQQGVRALHIKLYGMGRAKGAVVRTLQQSSLRVLVIRECTPAVHNGCRRPKSRRI